MHILFIGYGKTSQRVAKHLFEQGHQISTISQSQKTDTYATHHLQDMHQLDLNHFDPIDMVYVLVTPSQRGIEAYQQTYVESVVPIVQELKNHPVKRLVVVSSTRVYGEHAGEYVDDESPICPSDAQGHILQKMEQLWQSYFPKAIIVRPTGIYGTSIARLKKLAQQSQVYPSWHWSNRIHIDDLAKFLAMLAGLENIENSYIVSNNQPLAMHEILLWLQQQLHLPQLKLLSTQYTGKRIYATRLTQLDFQWVHPNCFLDYAKMLDEEK